MKKIFFIFFILICFLSILAAQEIDVYKRPLKYERSRDYDAKHYRLELTFDLEEKVFWGENKITLSPLKNDFKKCILDAEELIVTSVTYEKNVHLRFDQTDKNLIVHFPETYNYGDEVTFTVQYHAKDPKRGLFFDDEKPSNPLMVSTISWPVYAHHWFPCYDFPHDKVSSELIITVTNNNKVLSNGRLVSITEDKEKGTKTYHWFQKLPHSTYLFMLAIGPFEVIQDSLGSLPVNYWVYKKDVENAKWIFEKTPYMIDFFTKIFGYEYPWAKYDQATTPRQGGGAENTSATALGESVIHDRRAEQDFSWERIIAHEIAHMWWGDLVTLRTWSQTWLNESFATYSDYLYSHFDLGEDEGALALLGKKNQYLREAHTRYIRPIVFNRYDRPQQNFDSHTYPKGAAVLHMLRFVMGDDLFFKTLSHFLHKHAFQAVDTHDFMIAIKDVSGQNLDWFFEQFIFKPGHLVFNIGYTWNEKDNKLRLKIIQTQDTSKGIPVYKIPVVFGITTPKEKISKKIWIKEKEQVFDFNVKEKPLLVRFDEGNYLLKEWEFNKNFDELLYQLKNDDVIGRMWAASELAGSNASDQVIYGLIDRAQNDDFWAVRRNAVEAIGSFQRGEDLNLFKEICKDKNSKVRTAALKILGEFRNSKLIPFFKDLFRRDDSYLVQAEALRAMGKCGDNKQITFLENSSKMTSPRNVIKRAAEWAVNEIQKK